MLAEPAPTRGEQAARTPVSFPFEADELVGTSRKIEVELLKPQNLLDFVEESQRRLIDAEGLQIDAGEVGKGLLWPAQVSRSAVFSGS